MKLIFFFAFLVSVSAFAQPTVHTTRKIEAGNWQFTQYPGQIIKTTFSPYGYKYNEQVSNAVILKGIGKPKTNQVLFSNQEIIYALHKSVLSGDPDPASFVTLSEYFDSGIYKGFKFVLKADEKIFGTGERSIPMNRRGYKIKLYNNPSYGYGLNADNLNYSVPFIISSKGYGIFFDNPSLGYLDIGNTHPDILEYGASSGELTFYIIPGKNVAEILSRYQNLVGTQPIPARWVFGNLMSRFGYRSERQLMNTVDSMTKQNFPVDAVIIDLFWFGDSIKGTLGTLDWTNHAAWPAPARMMDTLKKKGIKTILITEPFVLNTTPNFLPSRRYHAVDSLGMPFLLTDFYFGQAGILDLFRKDAQNWFWYKYKKQVTNGVSGWWGDLGEPEKHPQEIRHNLTDLGFTRLFKADEVHNIYGHYWDKMLFEKYAQDYPSVRLFNLNRSGYAGSSRYGVFPWSGDVSRTWAGLQAQLPIMLGMSLSGVPYIHSDAGGFAGGDGDMDLYIRWLQFAVFTPVFRPHGTALGDLDPEVKNIPSEAALYPEPYKSLARNAILLRYKLLPYNYTLAYEQAGFGKALVKPLFYYDTSDNELYNAEDEFMWGDNILVAPILQKGTIQRKLYLPGGKWYQFFNDKEVPGHAWITDRVDSTAIPVYVRAGSFLPMFIHSNISNTNDYTGKEFTIKYYPSEIKTSYTLFDDDGISNNTLKSGNYDLIHFEGIMKGNDIHILITPERNVLHKRRKITLVLPAGFKLGPGSGNKLEILYTGQPLNLNFRAK